MHIASKLTKKTSSEIVIFRWIEQSTNRSLQVIVGETLIFQRDGRYEPFSKQISGAPSTTQRLTQTSGFLMAFYDTTSS